MASSAESECAKIGIKDDDLLSYVKSKDSALKPLPEIQSVTNGLVLELLRFKDSHDARLIHVILG